MQETSKQKTEWKNLLFKKKKNIILEYLGTPYSQEESMKSTPKETPYALAK